METRQPNYKISGGESAQDLANRVQPFVEELIHTNTQTI